jgi:hypothetical protein
VEVERDGDRQGADRGAHRLQEIALAVVDALHHHGPVQVEQDPVERAGRLQIGEQPRLGLRVEVLGDPPGRRGAGGQRGHQRDAAGGGAGDHPAQAGAGAAIGLEDLAAVAEIVRLELTAVGRNRTERVGLVRDHRDEEPHAASCCSAASGDFRRRQRGIV